MKVACVTECAVALKDEGHSGEVGRNQDNPFDCVRNSLAFRP
jgi:hypothetical protein